MIIRKTPKNNEGRPVLNITGNESILELIGGATQLLREIGERERCIDVAKKVVLLCSTPSDAVEVIEEYMQVQYISRVNKYV